MRFVVEREAKKSEKKRKKTLPLFFIFFFSPLFHARRVPFKYRTAKGRLHLSFASYLLSLY